MFVDSSVEKMRLELYPPELKLDENEAKVSGDHEDNVDTDLHDPSLSTTNQTSNKQRSTSVRTEQGVSTEVVLAKRVCAFHNI